MPLVFQSRVVEGQSFAGTNHMLQVTGREIQRFFLRVVSTLEGRITLNFGNFPQLSELSGSFFQVSVFVKANDIPQVHTCFAGTFFCFGIYRKYSFKMIGTQDVEHLIGRRNTRAGGYPANTRQRLVQDITHFRDELDEQFAVCCSHRNFNFRSLRSCAIGPPFVVLARNSRQGICKCIDIYFLHRLLLLFFWFYCFVFTFHFIFLSVFRISIEVIFKVGRFIAEFHRCSLRVDSHFLLVENQYFREPI